MKKKNTEFKSLFEYYGFTKTDAKKYPVISRILKELTPKRIEKEIQEVRKVKLPKELEKWVKEYEKVGDRQRFIWKWTYVGWKALTLPTVAKKYRNLVCITKTASIILNVLVDDLADRRKNKKMLEEAWNICFKYENNNKWTKCTHFKFSRKEQEYLELIKKIWNFLNSLIKKYPQYKELEDFFLYDYHQFFNSIEYGYLINKNFNFINLIECEVYSPHNMQGIIGMDMDLMCSPGFNIEEIGFFREIIWRAQQMGRIGNSVTTWEREIFEEDFSSDIFAFVLKHKLISAKGLQKEDKVTMITKISLILKIIF